MLQHIPIVLLATGMVVLALHIRRIDRALPLHRSAQPPAPDDTIAEPRVIIAPPHDVHRATLDHGRFLTNLSCELHAPLTGIIGFAERLLESCLQPAQRRQVELIGENGRAMLRLLGDVQDVGKIEAGELRIVAEPTDLRETLEQCACLMRPIAQTHGLALTATVDDSVPARVELDAVRLRQVLLNLVGNAVKFTESGKVQIEAHTMPMAGERQGICIAVTDTGIGIAEDRLQSIFRPFHHSEDKTSSQAARGTGLGLAISRRIVTAMGGDMAVQSVVGLGSCFTVHVPLVRPPRSHDAPSPARPLGSLRGRRVLVADSHDINQNLLVAMLEGLGLASTLVTSGDDAIEAVTEAAQHDMPFDLVLMDARMPGMDGLETTLRLRAAGYSAAALPVIALTAIGQPEDIDACQAAGMQACLAKPVRIEDLGRTLRRVIGSGVGQLEIPAYGGKDVQSGANGNPATVQRLERRYRERKAKLFSRLRATLDNHPSNGSEAHWRDIIGQLHKLAGVAANFGDGGLGDIAGQLEMGLRAAKEPAERIDLLGQTWPDMARFA
jgi:signal transduction histidine kinase/DNA-binding response OmpR family regulator